MHSRGRVPSIIGRYTDEGMLPFISKERVKEVSQNNKRVLACVFIKQLDFLDVKVMKPALPHEANSIVEVRHVFMC